MSTTETWTVGKLLTWTTDYLKKNGSQSPRLDAEVLLAHARECQRIELYTAFDEEPSEETKTAFREMVRRRAEGTPVAYLVGYKEFYSSRFEVSPDVLIPRPDTEHLVVEAIDCAKELRSRGKARLAIADVGTGSGIVGISLAKHVEDCRITAIDISPPALEVARRNAETHKLDDSVIEFVQSDLFESIAPNQRFDLVVSNPPYVSETEYQVLDKTVKEYEPRLALLSGPTGAEVIERLAVQALERLDSGGYLLFEFSPMLAPRLPEMVGAGWGEPRITKDLAGHARVVTLQKQ